ncbi:PUA-like domain-containing protein [Melampsora americana]|nr:PUA-like domain-containing protein [Melampsora americana]
MSEIAQSAWLMKAEPESRIVKVGKDVAFSATHLEKAGVEHWDGVRNHEAKKLMKDRMKVGDPVLFYHSNCKLPGISALARIHRSGYPDFTAFDPSHPYYDPKSSESSPTWYMVDLEFVSHLPHFVPLKVLQSLTLRSNPIPLPHYLTSEDLDAIREMALLNRGRLSVQPVSLKAFTAIKLLGEHGDWESLRRRTDSNLSKRKNTLTSTSSSSSSSGSKFKKSKALIDPKELVKEDRKGSSSIIKPNTRSKP